MMRFLLVVTALAAPVVATAQTTNCSRDVLGNLECVTKPPQSSVERARECETGGVGATILYGCSPAEIRFAKESKTIREKIGALIADGKCEEAKAIPLRVGDFDLAERVQKICVPKP
jgi:DUF917 family protein